MVKSGNKIQIFSIQIKYGKKFQEDKGNRKPKKEMKADNHNISDKIL